MYSMCAFVVCVGGCRSSVCWLHQSIRKYVLGPVTALQRRGSDYVQIDCVFWNAM